MSAAAIVPVDFGRPAVRPGNYLARNYLAQNYLA